VNFYDYIGLTPAEFNTRYVETGLVMVNTHHEFPLNIYNYSRKCVQEQVWDSVTSKCRGIIAHSTTGEVIARPFEKFHNFGTPMADDVLGNLGTEAYQQPVVWEKMDGFMCTLYEWEGVHYVASKGSFHSVHAKWATAEFRKKWGATMPFLPKGYTAVFEGLNRDLRIVIDYRDRQELVLLAVVNNETGEEYLPEQLKAFAGATGFKTPEQLRLTLEEARKESLDEGIVGEEGYVLTWYRAGTPFRLKMKFIEYIRLHRLVTNVSPKHIWEVLSQGQTTELVEYFQNSTPWFKEFAEKWVRALTGEYRRILKDGDALYHKAMTEVGFAYPESYRTLSELHGARKTFALAVGNSEFSGIAFALLDNKDLAPIVWKMVKPMTKNVNPLVNGFAY
jgi:RNA ligase